MNKLLRGHDSEETAYEVENYPYGAHRTSCRWWLETATKGAQKGKTRIMQQTLNPKTSKWNKAHASVFADVMVMYLDENDHCKAWHVCCMSPRYFVEFVKSGLYEQTNPEERGKIATWIKFYRQYDRTTWTRFCWTLRQVRAGMPLEKVMEAGKEDMNLYEKDVQEVIDIKDVPGIEEVLS